MRLAVIVATTGRSELLSQTVAWLGQQTRKPDQIVISAVSPADVGQTHCDGVPVEVLFGDKGLPKQRNKGLRHLQANCDIAIFFDDDFVPAPDYLEVLERLFTLRPNLVGATARLLADGIKGAGIAFEEAVAMVAAHKPAEIVNERRMPALYGCNLCIRLSAAEGIWFDEALPLYAWQEDVDFSFQLGQRGVLAYTNQLSGVHLGAKAGRTSGRRLGYSQIANPIYLLRKRTIPRALAWRLMTRNLAANLARSLWRDPLVDRTGRLRGNIEALLDLTVGRIHPERILRL